MKLFTEKLDAFVHSGWFVTIIVLISLGILYLILKSLYRYFCRKLIDAVEYRREFSTDGAFEGERIQLIETVYNRSFLPIVLVDIEGYVYNDLRVEEFEYDGKKAMQFYYSRFRMLLPFMQVRRRHDVICKKRGYYRLEGVEMVISDSNRYVESQTDIYVYPSPAEMPTRPMTMSLLQGESVSHNWLMRDPFNVSGIRDYVYGDPFNSINFKATARTGGYASGNIKVNNCDFISSRTVMIYVNFQTNVKKPIPTVTYEKIMERFLSYAVALICDAEDKGYRVGFAANYDVPGETRYIRFPVNGGNAHFRDILRSLALARFSPSVSFSGLVEHDVAARLTNTEIYVFSTYIDENAQARLYALSRMGNTVNTMIVNGSDSDEKNN